MHVEALSTWSHRLGREMVLNRYGHGGKPILVFPSSGGSHYEFADFGMIEACARPIEAGLVQFFTLDSIDRESWLCEWKAPIDRVKAHQAYDAYVIDELVPHLKYLTNWQGPMATTGCSMGAFHAVNFYLHHPDVFDTLIALSGVYDVRFFFGDYGDQSLIFEYCPSDFVWKLEDSWFIDHYRQGKIIVCSGLGAWEGDGLPSFYALRDGLAHLGVPAWFDLWGQDVAHDWPWWRLQLPYFLDKLLEVGL